MEDFSIGSMSYPGNLERVSQDKRARTLISCYEYLAKELDLAGHTKKNHGHQFTFRAGY